MSSNDRRKVMVTIQNRLGLHARPAMAFVDVANGFKAHVTVKKADDNEIVDGKSIMQVMMLAATHGTKLEVEATGPDAEEAVAALQTLVNNQFHEPE